LKGSLRGVLPRGAAVLVSIAFRLNARLKVGAVRECPEAGLWSQLPFGRMLD